MTSTLIFTGLLFLLPAIVLYLCARFPLLDTIGAVVICYLAGIIIGNVGVLPQGFASIQDIVTTITVPIALPLIFFSMHIANWKEQKRTVIKAFFGALAAVLLGSFISVLIFAPRLGQEAWKSAGMLVGCYSGGTPNMAAIGTALGVSTSTYIAVHASDVVVSGLLFLLIISIIPKLLRRILPNQEQALSTEEFQGNPQSDVYGQKEFTPYFSGFNRQDLSPLLRALLFSVLIFAVGGGLSLVLPGWIAPAAAIIVITTLGVAGSFNTRLRQTAFTFQLGYYFLLVFSLTVSSMANIGELQRTAPVMLQYVAFLLVITFCIHILLSRLLRVDADTHIITATALIFSPPFVPVVAAALKNREVIMAGMVTGIAGWVLGNYLGIAFAYLVRQFI